MLRNPGGRYLTFIFLLCWVWLEAVPLRAQELPQDLRISGMYGTISLDSAMNIITVQSGLQFAYSSDRIDTSVPVRLSVNQEPLTLVLQKLALAARCHYQIRRNKILLIPGSYTSGRSEKRAYILSGFVRDSLSGEVMIGATVMPEVQSTGTTTNAYGFYSLPLPEGKYNLQISYIGYKPTTYSVDLSQDITLNVQLEEDNTLLEEVVIKRQEHPLQVMDNLETTIISPEEMEEIPSFFGEHDVIKSLDLLPGVNLFGDGSTFFFVRGGNRDQNLLILDDAPLFNPSHLLGIFSTVIPEAVKDIKVYKGPFPPSIGGRLSSVIDIHTRDGNMRTFHSEGDLGLISARISMEGPVIKEKSSFFLSARRSWFDWILKPQAPQLDKLRFYDLNGKFNLVLNQKNRLFISGYAGGDIYRQRGENNVSSGIAWSNHSGSIRWYHIFKPDLFMNSILSASSYNYDLYTSFEDRFSWHSHISNIRFKHDISWFISSGNTLRTGLFLEGYNFNPGNFNYHGTIASPTDELVPIRNTLSYGGYLQHEVTIGKVSLDYGLRLSGWANIGATWENWYNNQHEAIKTIYYPSGKIYHNQVSLEPRISVSTPVGRGQRFSTGYSYTTQYMQIITNSVSPFTSFEVWLPSGPSLKPQHAHQVSAGYLKRWPEQGIQLSIDAWAKEMLNQADYSDHARLLLNNAIEGELRIGKAEAAGIEFSLRKETGRFKGRLGYTYSKVSWHIPEINNGHAYPAYYDRPHVLSLLLQYHPGRRWETMIYWHFSSGQPFSSPTAFIDYRGYTVPWYEKKNNDRMPSYHRLDLSATWHLSKPFRKFKHDLSFTLYNFYGRKNPWEINFNKMILEDGQLVVPGNYYTTPEIISSQIYVFQTIPSIHYHFSF